MKQNKIENFICAVERLSLAIDVYKKNPDNDIYQDALIQRFEFTFELSWKAIKEFMIASGLKDDLNFHKQIFKEAYQLNIIGDENVWLEMLNARNLTSHIYDESTASRISHDICEKFWDEIKRLSEIFK